MILGNLSTDNYFTVVYNILDVIMTNIINVVYFILLCLFPLKNSNVIEISFFDWLVNLLVVLAELGILGILVYLFISYVEQNKKSIISWRDLNIFSMFVYVFFGIFIGYILIIFTFLPTSLFFVKVFALNFIATHSYGVFIFSTVLSVFVFQSIYLKFLSSTLSINNSNNFKKPNDLSNFKPNDLSIFDDPIVNDPSDENVDEQQDDVPPIPPVPPSKPSSPAAVPVNPSEVLPSETGSENEQPDESTLVPNNRVKLEVREIKDDSKVLQSSKYETSGTIVDKNGKVTRFFYCKSTKVTRT